MKFFFLGLINITVVGLTHLLAIYNGLKRTVHKGECYFRSRKRRANLTSQ